MSTETIGALYCRLSNDDGKAGESRSIENQKKILCDWAENEGIEVYDTFIDDGYTGTNFDRPAFKRMMELVNLGKINCIIVKDLSRFGRNSAEMTKILERFSGYFDGRFVALMDNIDATSPDDYDMVFQILNTINEAEAQRSSVRVKFTWREKIKNGDFMFGTPAYGYIRDPSDKHKLIIDFEAAYVPKRIFREYADGKSAREIAEGLNRDGVPTYCALKQREVGRKNPDNPTKWSSNTVYQMLDNEVYIGVLAQGKRRKVSFKDNTRRMAKPEDIVRHEGLVEPIIDRALWDTVRAIRDSKRRTRRTKDKKVGLFSGKLVCGDCGAALAYTTAGQNQIYRCSQYNNAGSTACSSHYIREDFLASIVLEDIGQYAYASPKECKALKLRLLNLMNSTYSSETRLIKTEIANKNTKISEVNQLMDNLIRKSDMISDNIFQEKWTAYECQLKGLRSEVLHLEADLDKLEHTEDNINKFLAAIEQFLDMSEIDRPAIVKLVDTITIFDLSTRGGDKREVAIDIQYRFIGNPFGNKKAGTA